MRQKGFSNAMQVEWDALEINSQVINDNHLFKNKFFNYCKNFDVI